MECGLSYAVVLDEQGRFLKAANLNYCVGQELEQVVLLKSRRKAKPLQKILSLTAVAACLCILSLLAFQFVISPVGTIRMTINPDVAMKVNRLHYVVGLEGLNEDGKELIQGVDYSWKKVEEVSDELADRALEKGYLSQGDQIRLSVESGDTEWKTAAEEMIVAELKVHLDHEVAIILWGGEEDDHEDEQGASVTVSQPQNEMKPTPAPPTVTPTPSQVPPETNSSAGKPANGNDPDDDDDDDDHDDDRDEDDNDDDHDDDRDDDDNDEDRDDDRDDDDNDEDRDDDRDDDDNDEDRDDDNDDDDNDEDRDDDEEDDDDDDD